jgi:hypothetical protein
MSLVSIPRSVSVDPNGAPRVGAQWYFYEAGTDTPLPTYTTAALAIEHPIPVESQSDGYFPAVFINSTLFPTHKQVMLDADGLTVFVEDDVPTSDAAVLRADLADDDLAKGDALVTVDYDAIDAVPLNLHEYIEDTGAYLLMGFVPQANKSAIRARTSTADLSAYFQSAIDAVVDERTYGTVRLPMGQFRVNSTVHGREGVNILGEGGRASVIEANDCDGLTLDWQSTFGMTTLRGFLVQGVNGTTRTGIKVPGTLNHLDELYGLTLEGVLVRGFSDALSFRTVRNWVLNNCWFQDVRRALDLKGKNLVGRIDNCQFVYGAGNGAVGNSTGLILDLFNYTTSGGNVPPEGINVSKTQFFGFNTCIEAAFCNVLQLTEVSLSALVYGLDLTTIQNGFTCKGGDIEMTGAAAIAGVILRPLASAIKTNYKFEGVPINGGAGLTAGQCSGFVINNTGQNNQGNVHIAGSVVQNMTNRDVLWYNPHGANSIRDSAFESTLTSSSIEFVLDAASPAGHLTVIDNVQCADPITVPSTFTLAASGVRITNCRSEGTKTLHPNAIGWYEERDNTTTPALTLTDGSGASLAFSGVVAASTKQGREVLVGFQLTYPATADGSSASITGLPYPVPAAGEHRRRGFTAYSDAGDIVYLRPTLGSSALLLRKKDGTNYTNANLSGKTLTGEIRYSLW